MTSLLTIDVPVQRGRAGARADVPVEVQPSEVRPSEVLSAEVLPVEVLPVEVLPVEVLPVEVLPVEVLPVEVLPVEQPLPSAVLALAEADADAVADALHDGALQALVVARYAADAAVRGGDAAVTREAVQAALVALRRAVWLLRPRGDQGLEQALRDLARHLETTGGAPLRLDVDGPAAVALEALAPASATAAYRLVQHAAGNEPLTVRVRRTPSGLRLDLDAAVPDLAGEALRARAVGGTLLARSDSAQLLLPLTPSTGTSPRPAGPPSCEESP